MLTDSEKGLLMLVRQKLAYVYNRVGDMGSLSAIEDADRIVKGLLDGTPEPEEERR